MNIFILVKLILYYFFHADISIAENIGDKKFCFYEQSSSYCLPYHAHGNINKKDGQVNEIIIAIHGILKDSHKMCGEVAAGVSTFNKAHTLIICPQFLTKADAKKNALADNILYWSFEGWDDGRPAKNAKEKISSMETIDALIKQASNQATFPNLKKIKLIGFSAGAQLVQRYAVLTDIDNYLLKKNISITYVPVSPSSYLYLDPSRPKKYWNSRKSCMEYDNYKYGLENIDYSYHSEPQEKIRQKYKLKQVIYVVGSHDNSRFNPFLDKSCAANMQGLNRKERAENYFNYLVKLYGISIKKHQQIYFIKNANHHFSEKMLVLTEEKQ